MGVVRNGPRTTPVPGFSSTCDDDLRHAGYARFVLARAAGRLRLLARADLGLAEVTAERVAALAFGLARRDARLSSDGGVASPVLRPSALRPFAALPFLPL